MSDLSRRGFFGRVAALAAAAYGFAHAKPVPKFHTFSRAGDGIQAWINSAPTSAAVGGIDRATFKFWRSQHELGIRAAGNDQLEAMFHEMAECSRPQAQA